jgi:hypothetical protein
MSSDPTQKSPHSSHLPTAFQVDLFNVFLVPDLFLWNLQTEIKIFPVWGTFGIEFKGTVSRDFLLQVFFLESFFPKPLKITLAKVSNQNKTFLFEEIFSL